VENSYPKRSKIQVAEQSMLVVSQWEWAEILKERRMTNKRIVYETIDCDNAVTDLNAVLESATIRPIGLCCDGLGEATHIVLSRDE
jgi:hypothetical protein